MSSHSRTLSNVSSVSSLKPQASKPDLTSSIKQANKPVVVAAKPTPARTAQPQASTSKPVQIIKVKGPAASSTNRPSNRPAAPPQPEQYVELEDVPSECVHSFYHR